MYGHFFGQSSFATHTIVKERAAVKAPGDLSLAALAPFWPPVRVSATPGCRAGIRSTCPVPLPPWGSGRGSLNAAASKQPTELQLAQICVNSLTGTSSLSHVLL